MPNLGMFPLSTALLASQAVTTTGTSAVLTLPASQSYRFTVELVTASSTTTNFNLALFTSDDGGTTYHGLLAFTALTTSGQCLSALLKPNVGAGDAATITGTLPILGSTDFASNVNVVNSGPFNMQFLKARWQVATTGTVTFNLKVAAVPQDLSD